MCGQGNSRLALNQPRGSGAPRCSRISVPCTLHRASVPLKALYCGLCGSRRPQVQYSPADVLPPDPQRLYQGPVSGQCAVDRGGSGVRGQAGSNRLPLARPGSPRRGGEGARSRAAQPAEPYYGVDNTSCRDEHGTNLSDSWRLLLALGPGEAHGSAQGQLTSARHGCGGQAGCPWA